LKDKFGRLIEAMTFRRKNGKPEKLHAVGELGEICVSMKRITKRFPGVLANDKVDFAVRVGEIHALLGENGAGKTTLMNVLYGIHQPDEGEIYLYGKRVTFRSPSDAIALGISMVHQHFMLIPQFTVIENVILGLRSPREPLLDIIGAEKKIEILSKEYGLQVKSQSKISQLSVGERQRVEIIKALNRGASLLILDEPTAVLTPQEVKDLFRTLRSIIKSGITIILITHKLDEVMAVSDRVTILRGGKVVSTLETRETSKSELANMMVGREVIFRFPKKDIEKGNIVLKFDKILALNDQGLVALKSLSFVLHQGEILGIAGVSGNGQRELAEVITGLRRVVDGKIFINGRDLTNASPRHIMIEGVGYIPEERITRGLILDFSVAKNFILRDFESPTFSDSWFLPISKNWFLNDDAIGQFADKLISNYDIRTPSKDTVAKKLSGGNLQKIILAREFSRNPKLLIAAQPTRGLDVGATEYIRLKLIEKKNDGMAILLISEDLDEILSISDRIAVLFKGEIMGIVATQKANVIDIGLMMAGAKKAPNENIQCI
jgi:ABC-type uncharacterized transport system ATPase subunit